MAMLCIVTSTSPSSSLNPTAAACCHGGFHIKWNTLHNRFWSSSKGFDVSKSRSHSMIRTGGCMFHAFFLVVSVHVYILSYLWPFGIIIVFNNLRAGVIWHNRNKEECIWVFYAEAIMYLGKETDSKVLIFQMYEVRNLLMDLICIPKQKQNVAVGFSWMCSVSHYQIT
jgi:hypothetical protein